MQLRLFRAMPVLMCVALAAAGLPGCVTGADPDAVAGDNATNANSGANDNAAANDNNSGDNDNDGASNDNGVATNDNTSGSGNGCEDRNNLRVTYVNDSAVRVVFVENHRDASNTAVSARILSLQPKGSSGGTRVECIECPQTVGVRNIDYFDASPSSEGETPPDISRGAFRCGGGVTITFLADKTVSIVVDD